MPCSRLTWRTLAVQALCRGKCSWHLWYWQTSHKWISTESCCRRDNKWFDLTCSRTCWYRRVLVCWRWRIWNKTFHSALCDNRYCCILAWEPFSRDFSLALLVLLKLSAWKCYTYRHPQSRPRPRLWGQGQGWGQNPEAKAKSSRLMPRPRPREYFWIRAHLATMPTKHNWFFPPHYSA